MSFAEAHLPLLQRLVATSLKEVEKALVILWVDHNSGHHAGLTPAEIASFLEGAGSASVNRARLKCRLEGDGRGVKGVGGAFKVNPRRAQEIRALAEPLLGPIRPEVLATVIDPGLFTNAHNYVKNVVEQINVSYENDCQDCAAVMIRRLFETLIVDSFEAKGCIAEITDPNGNLLQLSGLIAALGKTRSFGISRQTKQASAQLKDVGDWSAHNRRHRARKSDIDAVAKHLRLACGDLLHLAGQD